MIAWRSAVTTTYVRDRDRKEGDGGEEEKRKGMRGTIKVGVRCEMVSVPPPLSVLFPTLASPFLFLCAREKERERERERVSVMRHETPSSLQNNKTVNLKKQHAIFFRDPHSPRPRLVSPFSHAGRGRLRFPLEGKKKEGGKNKLQRARLCTVFF
jgi:hypothetical protein